MKPQSSSLAHSDAVEAVWKYWKPTPKPADRGSRRNFASASRASSHFVRPPIKNSIDGDWSITNNQVDGHRAGLARLRLRRWRAARGTPPPCGRVGCQQPPVQAPAHRAGRAGGGRRTERADAAGSGRPDGGFLLPDAAPAADLRADRAARHLRRRGVRGQPGGRRPGVRDRSVAVDAVPHRRAYQVGRWPARRWRSFCAIRDRRGWASASSSSPRHRPAWPAPPTRTAGSCSPARAASAATRSNRSPAAPWPTTPA